jgi:hypothetical protein
MPGFGSLAPASDDDDLINRYYDPGTGLPVGGTDKYAPPRPRQPLYPADIGAALPEAYGAGQPIQDPLVTMGKKALWDVPRGLVDTARTTPYGLRREDVTDIPPDYTPDPTSPTRGYLPKVPWQPIDPLVGQSVGVASGVIGAPVIGPEEEAGEAILGAGAIRQRVKGAALKKAAGKTVQGATAEEAPEPSPDTQPMAGKVNWDRTKLGLGGIPLGKDQTVVDVPTRALEAAHKATDPDMYVPTPKQNVLDHVASGQPVALPEVNVYKGPSGSSALPQWELRYTNGRNRVAAARSLGEPTVPVAVKSDEAADLRALLAHHSPDYATGPASSITAPSILPRQNPTPDDVAAVMAAAREYGRKGWPTAEKEIFSTTPEAYGETTRLVPQISNKELLPGPLPGEKLPLDQRAAQIVENTGPISERIAQRLSPLVQQQSPLLKFYHTGPVIRGLERYGDMTTPEATSFMRDWSGQGAATSPRTQTPPNLRNASYLLYQRAMGNPLTPERFEREGNVPGFPMMGMHVDLANKFATGAENPWINPKPFTFRENWAGNLRDVTGDTHNIRSTLYEMDQAKPGSLHPSWFTSDDAYAKYRKDGFEALDPGDIKDTLGSVTVKGQKRQSEYLPMTEPWYRAARQLGINPAEAQSGGWFSYGPITGLQSPPKTIANLLNDQVAATAKALNVPPEKVVNWWSRGKIPLAGIAGGALGAGGFGSLRPPSAEERQ